MGTPKKWALDPWKSISGRKSGMEILADFVAIFLLKMPPKAVPGQKPEVVPSRRPGAQNVVFGPQGPRKCRISIGFSILGFRVAGPKMAILDPFFLLAGPQNRNCQKSRKSIPPETGSLHDGFGAPGPA